MRALWAIVATLDVVLFAMAAPISFGTESWIGETKYAFSLADLRLSPDFYAAYLTALHLALAAVFVICGVLIFLRKSDDGFVTLVSLASITAGAFFVPELTRLAIAQPVLTAPLYLLRALGILLALIVF